MDFSNQYEPKFRETYHTPNGREVSIRKIGPGASMFVITLSDKGDIPDVLKGQWTSVDMAERRVKSYLDGLETLRRRVEAGTLGKTEKRQAEKALADAGYDGASITQLEPRPTLSLTKQAVSTN